MSSSSLQPMIPWPFQDEGIERCLRKNTLINFERGLGKTLVGVEAGRRMREFTPTKMTLVIASPKSVRSQWVDTIKRQDPQTPIELWDGSTQYDNVPMGRPLWVIVYYDILPKMLPVLTRYLWSSVIADEAHKIKNKDAKRTIACKRIQGSRLLGLTADTFERSPGEMWSILNWFEPQRFRAYWPFDNKYVLRRPTPFGYDEVLGIKPEMVNEFVREVGPYIMHRTKAQVRPDMPPLIETTIDIELDAAQRRLYDKVRKQKDIEFVLDEHNSMLIKSKFTALHQIASWPEQAGFEGPSAKLSWLMEYVEGNPTGQMLVFSRYRRTALEIHRRISEQQKQMQAMVIGGQDPYRIDEFRRGEVRFLVGTIAALGEAYDLPMASTSIFVDCEMRANLMSQAMDRTHRLTITEAKHVIFLQAARTVDRHVMNMINGKWDEQQMLSRFLQEDLLA
jgi:SNF2 family DNA or RNA helicase